jgi:hypothetical protein
MAFVRSLEFAKQIARQVASRFGRSSNIPPDLVATELSELIETVSAANALNSILLTLNMKLQSVFHLFELYDGIDENEKEEITRIKRTYSYFSDQQNVTFSQVMMFLWGYEQLYNPARNLFTAEERTITMDHANDFKRLQEFGQELLNKMLANAGFIARCENIRITHDDDSPNRHKCAFKAAWILNKGDLNHIMDALLVREYDPRAMEQQHMTKLKVKNVLSVFFSERTAAAAAAAFRLLETPCRALEILPLSSFARYPQEIADVIYVPKHASMSLDEIESMIPDLTGLKGAFHEECKLCFKPFKKFKWGDLHSATCSTPVCALANPVCGTCIDTWRKTRDSHGHGNIPSCPFCKQESLLSDTIAPIIEPINGQLETAKNELMTFVAVFDFMKKCESIQSHLYYPHYVKDRCTTLMEKHQELQLNKANEERVKSMLGHVVTRLKRLDPSDPADYNDRLTATRKRKRGGARKRTTRVSRKQRKQRKSRKQRK